ncbi:MAG: helix-turn-helix domain-containing protein [Clostridia bacterium]|nr:helix-turn-helix domain-containing protein [Clostridia bacterium]
MTKEQWLAIKNADKSYDGKFYYALKRSKKVCRPSCRKAGCTPERVILFDTLQEALDRGYEPCSKCRPDKESWEGSRKELANAAKRLIEERYAEKFSLDTFAKELFVDKSYLLRTFKTFNGCTMLAYHNRVRCERAKELLQRPELPISYIASETGYISASHFTQVFRRETGQTPSAYRREYLRSLDV